ncbi:T9SS type A sorting domain-containing protein [bacterium]|nr:T9SS type A sorting domain-containing protein [bacterium]
MPRCPAPCLRPALALGVLLAAAVGIVAAPAHAQVSGFVLDQFTLSPVPDVMVTLQATQVKDTTAADGSFSLPGATGADLVIVGAKVGSFNAYATATSPASGVLIKIRTVPQEADTSYSFESPFQCGACHDQQIEQWYESPMSLCGQNTWVYDVYNGTGTPGGMGGFVYTRDSHHAAANPNSECASCHQPLSWIEEPFRALEDINNLSDNAMHGVSCDACHKVAHIDETKFAFPGMYPGVVTVTRPSAATGQVQYGVLGDTSFMVPIFMQPSYQPQLVAEVCGACHEDKNDPDGNGDFDEPNGITSEPTYNEWADSPYGDPQSPLFATCVDCHMPSYGAIHACNEIPPDRDPETIRHHRIEGTTAPYLENSVTLTCSGDVVGDSLQVQVSILNDLTGHSVPTGLPLRNMVLLVEAWSEGDGPLAPGGTQVVHDLGGVGDPAQGYYAGLPGKLYAKVTEDIDGESPAFPTDAVAIVFDNRIAALAADVTNYSFALPPLGGTIHARARLIYRRAFREFIDAKGWTTTGLGDPLEDIAPPTFGHLMEEDEFVLVIETGVLPGLEQADGAILFQNRPNPARANTSIRFTLPRPADVRLRVYDTAGRLVASLLDGPRGSGEHGVLWSGRDNGGQLVASGVYLYRLEADGTEVDARRMTWIR